MFLQCSLIGFGAGHQTALRVSNLELVAEGGSSLAIFVAEANKAKLLTQSDK